MQSHTYEKKVAVSLLVLIKIIHVENIVMYFNLMLLYIYMYVRFLNNRSSYVRMFLILFSKKKSFKKKTYTHKNIIRTCVCSFNSQKEFIFNDFVCCL